MDLAIEPGMRILDLGCGRAATSIFLANEYDVTIEAVDLWFSAEENNQRIKDAGVSEKVQFQQGDARGLAFEEKSFDMILSIDSFPYYGTDETYLPYILRFLKDDGILGIAGASLTKEFDHQIPDHLKDWWEPGLWVLHSPEWWVHHWQKTGLVTIREKSILENSINQWIDWVEWIAPYNELELETLKRDNGEWLCYAKTVCQRKDDIELDPLVDSIPPDYQYHPAYK